MPTTSQSIQLIDLTKTDGTQFVYQGTSCIVLTKDDKILLQQRGDDWQHFPGCLAAFGGQIESNETPIQALIRELHEELGAKVMASDVIMLGVVTEAATQHQDLIYEYFWHDKLGIITGCYEGEAKYYDDVKTALAHPKVMDDVRWALQECQKRKLLK